MVSMCLRNKETVLKLIFRFKSVFENRKNAEVLNKE